MAELPTIWAAKTLKNRTCSRLILFHGVTGRPGLKVFLKEYPVNGQELEN
jgi:hypothetical protein